MLILLEPSDTTRWPTNHRIYRVSEEPIEHMTATGKVFEASDVKQIQNSIKRFPNKWIRCLVASSLVVTSADINLVHLSI